MQHASALKICQVAQHVVAKETLQSAVCVTTRGYAELLKGLRHLQESVRNFVRLTIPGREVQQSLAQAAPKLFSKAFVGRDLGITAATSAPTAVTTRAIDM